MVEAGDLTGPDGRGDGRGQPGGPPRASATRTASPSSRGRPGATIDTLLLGCTHYPLLRPIIADIVGERVAIVDSATATASALAELLSVNGLEAAAGAAPASHRQLTTGDPARFGALAGRLFGTDFPDVESVELGVLAG